jgi:hypothetical protein
MTTPLFIVTGPTLEALYPVGNVYVVAIVLLLSTMPLEAISSAAVTVAVTTKLVPVAAPITGVTNVGVVLNTTAPDPVLVVTPVPPAKTGRVPAAKAPALVEYKALLAAVKVVSPVPP